MHAAWQWIGLSTPEREAILFTLRDLVVLALVVGMLLWLVFRVRRK